MMPALDQCPECRDQKVIWMLTEEWPCPWCRTGEYEEKLTQQCIDLGELASWIIQTTVEGDS